MCDGPLMAWAVIALNKQRLVTLVSMPPFGIGCVGLRSMRAEISCPTTMDIQTAIRAKNFSKTCFLKPSGAENFFKSFLRCDRFWQTVVQIEAILAILQPFETFRAVWISLALVQVHLAQHLSRGTCFGSARHACPWGSQQLALQQPQKLTVVLKWNDNERN